MYKFISIALIGATISTAILADSRPVQLSVENFTPDELKMNITKISNGETKVTLETGNKNDVFFDYNDNDIFLPMQIEITSKGGNMDITRAKAAAIRWINDNSALKGYEFTADIGEFDFKKRMSDHSRYEQTKINLINFIPTFSLKLDSGEDVVISFKGNLAFGIAHNFARVNGIEDEDFADWSIGYGASAGVTLYKALSISRYLEKTSSPNMDNTITGFRAKSSLPNFSVFKSRSGKDNFKDNNFQLYRECSEITLGPRSDEECFWGAGISLGL